MKTLIITPLGPFRTASTPIYHGALYMGRQTVIGIPQPSTVLGMLGAALSIHIDEEAAKKDPLMGITPLVDALSTNHNQPVLLGPIIRIRKGQKQVLALPVHAGEQTILVALEALQKATFDGRTLYISTEYIVGYSKTIIQPGIALKDTVSNTPNRVVEPGYTFRRGLVYYTDEKGETLSVDFIFKLTPDIPPLETAVRLGGEGRLATIRVTDDDQQVHLESPLTAEPGPYIITSFWPLIPTKNTPVYLPSKDLVGLEYFDNPSKDIAGLPSFNPSQPAKLRVVRLGLGYSEVLKTRRPIIPALPPGTIIHLKKTTKDAKNLPHPYLTLLRAGYASILKITLNPT